MASFPDESESRLVPVERRSTFALIRSVVMSMTHVVEDSTELVGASVREELERFRLEMARHALAIIAVVTGTSLVSAGLAMFLSELLGSWPLTLVLFGGVYLGIALWLYRFAGPPDSGDSGDSGNVR